MNIRRIVWVPFFILLMLQGFTAIAQDRNRVQIGPVEHTIDLADQGIFRLPLFALHGNGFVMYDYSRHRLVKFEDGDLNVIASGKGGGPEEFENPTDLSVDERGHIWLADPMQARISVWDKTGELVRDFNHGRSLPSAIAAFEGQYLVKWQNYSNHELLQIFNEDDILTGSFEGLNPDLKKSDFLTEAEVYADETGFYFAPYYSGHLYKFDESGKEIFSKNTVEPVPVAEIVTEVKEIPEVGDARITRVAVEAKKASLDIATDQKYVYVLFSGTESGAGRIIDVYDKMNGEYVQSIKLDREAYRMGINDEWLFLLFYDESSKSYKVARHELPGLLPIES